MYSVHRFSAQPVSILTYQIPALTNLYCLVNTGLSIVIVVQAIIQKVSSLKNRTKDPPVSEFDP